MDLIRTPEFVRLNKGWSAEPSAPSPEVETEASSVFLSFFLDPWAYGAGQWQVGTLSFENCRCWRLGPTNDEGWYHGQCRYSRIAPAWGEFYELVGDDDLRDQPDDWLLTAPQGTGQRHFLFYLRDETFECLAQGWAYRSGRD